MNHKILFGFILIGALLSGAGAHAQASRAGRAVPKPRVIATGVGLKDGLTMQKGRVVLTELGISNPLTADKKLINGTIITQAGVVTTPDGTTTQMGEGDQVSLTGRVTSRAAIVESDSLAKIKLFDALHPGKRKKMEEERDRKAKVKAKLAENKLKMKEKAAKRKK